MTQLIGHGLMLQSLVSVDNGQRAPPCALLTTTDRVLTVFPPPQVKLQVDQADQALMTQSIGHGWVLQLLFSSESGHGLPPKFGATEIARVLLVLPPPHFSLQAVHDAHSVTTQSIGHG